MSQKTNKISRKIASILACLILVVFALFLMFDNGLFYGFSNVKFDKNSIKYVNSQIKVYDNNGLQINEDMLVKQNVKLSNLPSFVKEAFISIEDKSFYKHKGINYKRIIGAMVKNIRSGNFSEGASTISQQLIKNTHLSNEKTLSRKVNEILLTQKLEKDFEKDEILQAYLNVIYFGNGTFGIEQASQKYFNKSAEKLQLSEAAVLAGLIKSPKTYCPITNAKNCLKRRNLVLKEMFNDGKITKKQYEDNVAKDLGLDINKNTNKSNSYVQASINEACDILNINEKDLVMGNYKIYTYQDRQLQDKLKQIVSNQTTQNNPDKLAMVMNNLTCGIEGYFGESKHNLITIKRQPGSTIKPVLVYAPALEYNLISPNTPILDEALKIDNYTPKNYLNKYHGWTNIENSIMQSLNIPAIKTLEYVGIDKAKLFAKNFGLNLTDKDNGYSIALGGLTDGLNIKDVINSYIPFSNGGKFSQAKFVKKIENKYGRTIYSHKPKFTQVIRDDTAYLMTNMLQKTALLGTAKKMSDIDLPVACKTGTVGSTYNSTNTDAWNISYNTNHVVGVWLGNTSQDKTLNLPKNVTGANQPTLIAKKVFEYLDNHNDFIKPDSVIECDIDTLNLRQNNTLKLASKSTPERYKQTMLFSKNNLPKQTSTLFTDIEDFNITSKSSDDGVQITIPCKGYLTYSLYKISNGKKQLLIEIENKSNNYVYKDSNLHQNTLYEYYVEAKMRVDGDNITKNSNTITIYKTDNKKTISNNEIVWE